VERAQEALDRSAAVLPRGADRPVAEYLRAATRRLHDRVGSEGLCLMGPRFSEDVETPGHPTHEARTQVGDFLRQRLGVTAVHRS